MSYSSLFFTTRPSLRHRPRSHPLGPVVRAATASQEPNELYLARRGGTSNLNLNACERIGYSRSVSTRKLSERDRNCDRLKFPGGITSALLRESERE